MVSLCSYCRGGVPDSLRQRRAVLRLRAGGVCQAVAATLFTYLLGSERGASDVAALERESIATDRGEPCDSFRLPDGWEIRSCFCSTGSSLSAASERKPLFQRRRTHVGAPPS